MWNIATGDGKRPKLLETVAGISVDSDSKTHAQQPFWSNSTP